MNETYTSGEYLEKNPSWHEEDSLWKAGLIQKMLMRNQLVSKRVCEIGCGAGLVLASLQNLLDASIGFEGYDISPQAIERAQSRANKSLNFHQEDILDQTQKRFDLILLIDVIEHLEDCFEFLRKIKPMSPYKLLHIPLDLSVQSVARVKPILKQRASVGHIQYFTKELALAVLQDSGYEVVDWFYTGAAVNGPAHSVLNRWMRLPRKILFRVNPDWTVRWLGGYSLMVLVK